MKSIVGAGNAITDIFISLPDNLLLERFRLTPGSVNHVDEAAVTEILAPKIPVSIKLGSLSLLVSLCIGLPMGTMMAKYKGKFFDNLGAGFIVLIQAVPSAVYYLFIQLFGTELFGISLL